MLYGIVDLHALTVHQAPILLRESVKGMAVCLLACGVDPARSVLFQQSQARDTWCLHFSAIRAYLVLDHSLHGNGIVHEASIGS